MTKGQRAQIDYMRSKNTSLIDRVINRNDDEEASMQVNGFFFKNRDKREGGSVWINGKQMTGSDPETGMRVEKINEKNKTVSVMFEDTNTSMPLKAGQKVMLQDGAVQDAYEP